MFGEAALIQACCCLYSSKRRRHCDGVASTHLGGCDGLFAEWDACVVCDVEGYVAGDAWEWAVAEWGCEEFVSDGDDDVACGAFAEVTCGCVVHGFVCAVG